LGATLEDIADRVELVSDLYASRNDVRRDDDWFALKLLEEAGELVAEHLRLTGRSRLKGSSEADIRLARDDEAADLLAMVLLYCRHNAIDIEAALERKWFRHLEPAK
jgi:NTP pyrophosphatase (non-canonical NTP hydrolase)